MSWLIDLIKRALPKPQPPPKPALTILPTGIQAQYDAGTRDRLRPITSIDEMVIHGTAGGQTAAAVLRWMGAGELAHQYRRGIALFHYLVDRDGTLYQVIQPERWCYHSSSGVHDKRTIGVELVNPNRSNGGAYTAEQHEAVVRLYLHLVGRGAPIRRLIGHGRNQLKYSPSHGYKQCPGPGFRWDVVADQLGGKIETEEIRL